MIKYDFLTKKIIEDDGCFIISLKEKKGYRSENYILSEQKILSETSHCYIDDKYKMTGLFILKNNQINITHQSFINYFLDIHNEHVLKSICQKNHYQIRNFVDKEDLEKLISEKPSVLNDLSDYLMNNPKIFLSKESFLHAWKNYFLSFEEYTLKRENLVFNKKELQNYGLHNMMMFVKNLYIDFVDNFFMEHIDKIDKFNHAEKEKKYFALYSINQNISNNIFFQDRGEILESHMIEQDILDRSAFMKVFELKKSNIILNQISKSFAHMNAFITPHENIQFNEITHYQEMTQHYHQKIMKVGG